MEKVLLAAPEAKRRRDAVCQPSAKRLKISKVTTRKKPTPILTVSDSEDELTEEPAKNGVDLLASTAGEILLEPPAVKAPSFHLQSTISAAVDVPGSPQAIGSSADISESPRGNVWPVVEAQRSPTPENPAPPPSTSTIQAALPPPSQRSVPADLTDRLKEAVDLLEKPINVMVQSVDRLHAVLNTMAVRLPFDVMQALLCAADISFHREEVTAASAQIAAGQKEAVDAP